MSAVTAPEGVDVETGEMVATPSRPVVLFNRDEAEAHTAKMQGYCAALCLLVKEAHEKQVWKPLGYKSWAAYIDDRFHQKISRSRSYQLIDQAQIAAGIADATGVDLSTVVDTFSEGQTRNLDVDRAAPLIREAIMNLSPKASTADRLKVAAGIVEQLRVTVTRTVTTPPAAPAKPAPKPKPKPSPEPTPTPAAGDAPEAAPSPPVASGAPISEDGPAPSSDGTEGTVTAPVSRQAPAVPSEADSAPATAASGEGDAGSTTATEPPASPLAQQIAQACGDLLRATFIEPTSVVDYLGRTEAAELLADVQAWVLRLEQAIGEAS